MQVWWLFTIKTFDFFEYMQVLCTFGIKMLIFFEYMQVWCALVKMMHFLLLMQVLERYNSQNLQRVCNIEVNKAQIKTGFRFWCFVYFIFMKNKNHQNKINRMCIKHGNLQCFLSILMYSTPHLVVIHSPPPEVGPGGGATIYIYKESGWCFQISFFNVYRYFGGFFPIWLIFFQMRWTHQLGI